MTPEHRQDRHQREAQSPLDKTSSFPVKYPKRVRKGSVEDPEGDRGPASRPGRGVAVVNSGNICSKGPQKSAGEPQTP